MLKMHFESERENKEPKPMEVRRGLIPESVASVLWPHHKILSPKILVFQGNLNSLPFSVFPSFEGIKSEMHVMDDGPALGEPGW